MVFGFYQSIILQYILPPFPFAFFKHFKMRPSFALYDNYVVRVYLNPFQHMR